VKRTAGFRVATSALIAAAITLLSWAGLAAGAFQGTQLRLVDALFPAIGPDDRIAVVAVDENSLDAIGLAWPWPRSIHADLVRALRSGGADLIGYDVTFAEPTDPEEDAALAGAIAEGDDVVLAANAIFRGRLQDPPRAVDLDLPIPALGDAAAAVAHANVIPDPDGVVRALPPVIESPDLDYVPSLSLALYALEEDVEGQLTFRPDGWQIGDRLIPTGRAHLMDVNFSARAEYPTYQAIEVLEGEVPADAFEGKIVLVGATALGLGDTRLTPLNKTTGEPGVFVHANALNTMLTRAFLFPDGRVSVLVAVFVVALLSAMAVAFLRVWASPVVVLGIGTAYFLLAFWRFDQGHVMNLVYPALGMVVAFIGTLGVRYFTEERERRRVTRVFGRYVAQDVVDEVLAAPEAALATLEGQSRTISVLFADLRGFTSASDGAEPEQVVEALNVYLDAMVRAVNEERGTIDKFMGDCVMAFWGAPRPTENHAEHAARAGIRMLDYIDEAVAAGRTSGLEVAGCGVGIATGGAVVGNIGSHDRLDYTVVGDTVNTASRLCGVAGPGQIVVTEACAAEIRDRFRIGDLPSLEVKGKAKPLRVFQVLREGQEAPEVMEGAVVEYSEEKGHFEQTAPAKAAGYAPIEPRQQDEEPLAP
jgi:adenylate cyclase